jgi:hypothetical protein
MGQGKSHLAHFDDFFFSAVIPAKAGIQGHRLCHLPWMPAFAGMTRKSGAGCEKPHAPTALGSRQARSKGRRQAWGAISWWIDCGPQEPGA